MPKNPFLKCLKRGLIVADGPNEELYLSNTKAIQKAHLNYINSGAEIIRTTSRKANSYYLKKFGLECKVNYINVKAAKTAKYARDISGKSIFIAGNIGPIKGNNVEAFLKEQVEALIEGGVDLLLFDNFDRLLDLELAIKVSKALCELPLVLGFNLDNLKDIEELILKVKKFKTVPLALFLNRPLITALDAVIKKLKDNKIAIIGGGTGSTPKDIQKISNLIFPLRQSEISFSLKINLLKDRDTPTLLAKKIAKGEFILCAEIDPPKGVLAQKDLEGAALLKESGVDFINVGDSPLARIRMDAKDFCFLVQQETGLETILHFTTRDRSLLKLQADLLGTHVLGIRNVLALTGDPLKTGNCPEASEVFDIHSTQLVDLIKNKLNQGVDWYGNPLGGETSLFVAVALDLNVPTDNVKWEYFTQKIKVGADIAMTQPIFESAPLLRFLERVDGKPPIPIIVGILPLQSERHAIFLNDKVEGIYIPDKILEDLRNAGSKALDVGIKLALKLVMEVKKYVAGIYIVPSFGRYEIAAEVAKIIKEA